MRILDFEIRNGQVFAYEADVSSPSLPNWLSDELGEDDVRKIADATASFAGNFAICKSIHVPETRRGKGLGSRLLDGLLEKTGADILFLVADRHQAQATGFDLKKWYESRGFVQISETPSGPMMAWPEDAANTLLERMTCATNHTL